MTNYLLFSLFLFYVFPNLATADDITIHTDGNSYYYPDIDKRKTIVLPSHEIIDTEDIDNLEENQEPFITNEGVELNRVYDGQFFMEDAGENE
jgi:hypothetical protein